MNDHDKNQVTGNAQYTGVEPEPRRPASSRVVPFNWLSGAIVRITKQAKSVFAVKPYYPKSFNWDEKAALASPGAQGEVTACVSYAGCLTAEIRYQLQTGKTLRLAPRVFHFCTLRLDWDQGTNSRDFGYKAVTWGLPYAQVDELALRAQTLSGKGDCDSFADWPRLRVTELLRFETQEAVKHEISTNGPVVAHIALHDGFLNGYVPGSVYEPSSGAQGIGVHAICLIGYDDDKGYWVGINSSGAGWGNNGRFLLRYGTCELLGQDMPVYAPRVQP